MCYMEKLPRITDLQEYFLADAKPVLECWPGGINALSKMASINKTTLSGFLGEKNGLDEIQFTRLVGCIDSEYELVEWDSKSFDEFFTSIKEMYVGCDF